MADNKKVVILGGGTVSYVRNHLALSTPAYGTTAKLLKKLCLEHSDKLDINLVLTKMADFNSNIETPLDVSNYVDNCIIADPSVKIVFFNAAIVDFSGFIDDGDNLTVSGKYSPRLETRVSTDSEISRAYKMSLMPNLKIISKIRKTRKDIFLIGFKTTCGADPQKQYLSGLNLVKEASCNLVLANDTKTRLNMVITPEEAAYHQSNDRETSLRGLVEMAYLRSHLTFTRSTVVSGDPVSWDSELVPASIRQVVNHCVDQGAYKPFNGATVGHFAVKVNDTTFLTSKRKTNFNEISKIGLVKVQTDGPDSVVAYGDKPSVGGQSQRIVFSEHKDCDCIVHFHSPLKESAKNDIPVVSQREVECGSHQCGQNTSRNLKKFGNLYAVMLDQHGPNIVFNRDIDPQEVISFIDSNFDLQNKTGGYNLEIRANYADDLS